MPHALTPLALHVSTIIAVALVVVLAPTSGSAGEPDPVASSDAVVTAPGARFTVLTPSLLRLEHLTPPVVSTAGTQVGGDDRATTVVINRRLPVPAFSVTHPNATTTVITTAQLRLTYTAPGPLHLSEAPPTRKHPGSDSRSDTTTDTCGCSATNTTTTCVSDGGPRDAVWTVHADTQGGDGHRTPSHPDGLANQTLSSCFCACMADPDCTAFTYAPPGQDLGRSCWLLAGVSKTMSVGDRVFAGVVSGGFTDATLQIEMLDRAAPVRVWRPSMGHGRNLNGSYPALDCYTVPAACAASNQRRMEPGLLSRDGWAVWNDIESPRMVRTPESVTVRYAAWHTANLMNVTDEDLYFWGHGLDFRGALKDFLQISGPPGLLSAADYGLWWSNSFVFTKDQFLNRLISNFTKHSLPFTHLVMDYGWHQQQDGKLWASYTWSETLFGDPAEVQAFVQSLHSTDPTSPLGRPLALSLNLHPVGVEPPELRYPEFERQIGADPTKNQTMPCSQSNETWMSALFDQVLDAPPNSGVDSWWTDGTCDGGTYGGDWNNQYAYGARLAEHRELRGYVMSRWGGVGSQRLPLGFSGDQTTAWPTLQFQVQSTPTAANVMFNAWSHDIGGFDCCGGEQGGGLYGKCPFPAWAGCETNSSTDTGSQLLVRWLQYGALSAVDRVHCGGCNREFWTFPNFEAMRDAMNFRAALFPYLYTENHATRHTGVSLLHPVYYEDGAGTIDRAFEPSTTYMFGSAMLVAPIVAAIESGSSGVTETTWLPPGSWVAFSGSASHLSPLGVGLNVTAIYGLDGLPIFIRAGAAVPLRTAASLSQPVAFSDPLVWSVWPGTVASGGGTVVEDDGATLRFDTANATATTSVQWHATPTGFTLTVNPTVGTFDANGDCTEIDMGFEYGGAGADLAVLPGTFASPADCCVACSTFSNCAFWTWLRDGKACTLKVSRQGRAMNSSAVSGVAPRRMPTTRAHHFQLRSPDAAATVTVVTVNGESIARVSPPNDGGVGWFVQPSLAGLGLSRTPTGTLVIQTASMSIRETVTVSITN